MKKQANRSAQYPLVAEFQFAFNEWVQDSVDLTKKTLGSTVANSTDPLEVGLLGPVANTIVFDGISMPLGAVITGGELIIDVAGVGPTAYTAKVGISGDDAALLAATDIKAAAGTRTALLLTKPLLCNGGTNVRVTVAYTVANATAGKARVRVHYTVDGRAQEVQSS